MGQKVITIAGIVGGVVGEGKLSFDYRFSTAIVAPPSSKNVNLNNATQNIATKIYVNTVNDSGAEIGDLLRTFTAVGDKLVVFNRTDAGQRLVYDVTAITDQTTYIEYDITFSDSLGAAFTNNQKILVAWFSTSSGGGGVTNFSSLTDTPSSYLGQGLNIVRVATAETGLEYFTIAHSDLTGIGTNTHVQIDTHIGLVNPHLDWTLASQGIIHATNYVDNDTTDHTALSNIGTNSHAQIDTHIANVANPHAVKEEQAEGTRLDDATVTGSQALDWDAYKVFEFTLTGNTTITDSNLPTGTETKVIEMVVTGDFTFTFPAYYEALPSNDSYDGTKRNHIVITCIVGTGASEDVIYSLQTLTT